jgi:hypothetical protein
MGVLIMKNTSKLLILMTFISISVEAFAHSRENTDKFHPYLEDSRHLQIPQWQTKNWYLEDWTSQKSADAILRDLYRADIFKDQTVDRKKRPILVVGKNFYRLSGFDKRRVTTLLNNAYDVTGSNPEGAFFLKDWKTGQFIGVFDEYGLRLH